VLFSVVLAFGLTSLAMPVVIRVLRRGNVFDLPNARSSHEVPTPRGGGIAVAAGVVAGVAVAPALDGDVRAAILVAGLMCGAVGLLDDLFGIPALARLPLLFVAAAACLPWLLAGLGGAPAWKIAFAAGTVVWIVSYVNAFNFMDGINGIAGSQVVVAGAAWLLIGRAEDPEWLAGVAAVLAVTALAFLPYNVPRARVFLGDAGSYFLGAVLAVVAVAAVRAGLPVEAVIAPLAVFLADTGVTLVRRVLRGEPWYEAHRQHAYQQLTTCFGGSHTRANAVAFVTMALCAALGSLSLLDSVPLRIAGGAGLALVLTGYLALPSILSRSRRPEPAFAG
jgi:UDP-N-acetylmuramyl pentapeptide phosphotransferase/UDP-N-acetylglucosamine-1-phosphate transferase